MTKRNAMDKKTEIFFHVGLGKAASTYLQYSVFPFFEDIHYIQRTRYKHTKAIVGEEKHKRYLVSREFDRQLKSEVEHFAKDFPRARTIIIFRRHDSWIASQYRRFLKNGNPWSFQEFFDIENDNGQWKQEELNFFGKIQTLEKHFETPPLVLFYEDMRKGPIAFFRRIADFCGASFDPKHIDLSKRHSSYQPRQLKAIYALSQRIDLRKHQNYRWKAANVSRRLLVNAIRYPTLYAAKWLPETLFSSEPLIPKKQLEQIREHFADDWKRCQEYAKQHNP